MRSLIEVVTGPEAAARDAASIGAGVPSRALMGRAGAAAAGEIIRRHRELLARGVLVLAGPGNNGGDGWVVARALVAAGVDVHVVAPAGARSQDCVAERDLTPGTVSHSKWSAGTAYTGQGIVVDALLGTGASGPLREEFSGTPELLALARRRGAAIVALDLPSGVDATTGEANGAVAADTTIAFGTIKRGNLMARGLCGTIVVVDIGLTASRDSNASLVDAKWVSERIPRIGADAHKGTRKKLLVHGGGPGMAGAAILALRAALASGIGMARARVHSSSVEAIHVAVPAALVDAWADSEAGGWADVLVIGPGLGRATDTRASVETAIARHRGPVLLDADALNAFSGDLPALRAAIGGHSALITPHVAELARLVGETTELVLARRFEIGADVARETGAVVLLKGVPTVVSAPDGRCFIIPAGTPALATAGSGDVLSGIAGTLLAQMENPSQAAACAAWIHGRASELAGAHARGTTLEDVLAMLPNAWSIDSRMPEYPVLAELRAVAAE